MNEGIKRENSYKQEKDSNLETISQLKKDIKVKDEEIRQISLELKTKEETLNKIIENYDHNNNDHKDMINKFNKEILDLNEKIKKQNEEINNNNIQLKNKDNEILEISEKKNNLENDIKKMNEQLEKLKNENFELILSNDEFTNQITNFKSEKEERNEEMNKNKNEIKKLKDENEEKILQINELVKKINDNEIQIKDLKFQNDEKKQIDKELKQKENKINSLTNDITNLQNKNEQLEKENNDIKNQNKNLSEKILFYEEEKIKLINNLNNKESEYNSNKKKVTDLSKQNEDFKSILSQKVEEIEKLKINNSKLGSELNLANLDIKQKDENIKQLEEKYNILKNETMNNGISTATNNNDSNNNELIKIIEENNQLNKEKSNLSKELLIMKENNAQIADELLKSKQEKDSLQNKINKLNEENITVNNNFNQINSKYNELEKENKNLKEISEALIEKQKNQVEKENKVDPGIYNIVTSKKHKKLIWYLICKKKNEPNDTKEQNVINDPENNYSNYRWVTGQIIKRNQLEKFNKFETDEQKIKDLQEYIINLQKKLERKEESINIMDYKNKKLIEANHNKTASVKGALKANLMADISKNTINNNQNKNNSATEIIQLQNEILKLRDEIKAKEKLEQAIPKNIYIKHQENDDDSDFLDEDIKDDKVGGMMDFIKTKTDAFEEANSRKSGVPGVSTKSQGSTNNDYKASERKVDEFLNKGAIEENDLDIVKQMQEQMKCLKDEIKDMNNRYNLLSEQFKELLKNIKCDMKIKPQIVQICQIFGFSPETINKIVTNKKKGIF